MGGKLCLFKVHLYSIDWNWLGMQVVVYFTDVDIITYGTCAYNSLFGEEL